MREKFVLQKALDEGRTLTFGDVRLRTGHSTTPPERVGITTKFSNNVGLKIPIVSAAMDTVTEWELAIALAKMGGLGVIHKNLSPEEQERQVGRVKHNLNAIVERPITHALRTTVREVLENNKMKGYHFKTFPIISSQGVLEGIVTGTDFEFCTDESLTMQDIMSRNPLTAKEGTTSQQAYNIMMKEKRKVLPIVDEQGRIKSMYVFRDVQRIMNESGKDHNLDDKGRLMVGAAIGVDDDARERAEKLVRANVDVLVIDTAHADTENVIETLKELKRTYAQTDVVVGNVSIGDSARRLAEAGADGIKVGQGPGSICTTRIVAGVGRPQVSAVYDCTKSITDKFGNSEERPPICADGGIKYSGDLPIIIAAGAHCVMLGSVLAGVEETPGDIITQGGVRWKAYRGMGSLGAMEESKASRQRYLQSDVPKNQLVPEGVEALVPSKGPLESVIVQYVGGLRKGMGYVGAKNITELREKGDFDQITPVGMAESHPHNIQITEEPPNYEVKK